MQTTGTTLLTVRLCSLARAWMLAQGIRSVYGLLGTAPGRDQIAQRRDPHMAE